ncbi:MAG TPA: NAD(P)-dependent oxidoreductase [Burkholderiales bacterium]|nr:NAD(P)-dependent oxidoreductase [Burkholderiales bacterium]
MALRAGWIGLGAMGAPMAMHLLRAGYALAVWARRKEAIKSHVDAGAKRCGSPAEVAASADVVFTMVTATADSEAVALGAGGIAEGARPGTVVVDMATVSPVATREIAAKLKARDLEHLDAPVSGGPAGAAAATLAIMVGGRPEVFARVKPLLARLGRHVLHMGGHGAGQVTKLCNQVAQVVNIQGIAEAMLFAAVNGVDPAKVREALMGGFAASKMLELLGERMVERTFDAGIPARLHHKDFGIVVELAHELGIAMPATALTAQQLAALMGHGWGTYDTSSLLRVLEAQSGVKPGG